MEEGMAGEQGWEEEGKPQIRCTFKAQFVGKRDICLARQPSHSGFHPSLLFGEYCVFYSPCFTDGETETQRGEGIC
jgi:hypothetical protein